VLCDGPKLRTVDIARYLLGSSAASPGYAARSHARFASRYLRIAADLAGQPVSDNRQQEQHAGNDDIRGEGNACHPQYRNIFDRQQVGAGNQRRDIETWRPEGGRYQNRHLEADVWLLALTPQQPERC